MDGTAPGSYGVPSMMDAADPFVLVDGQTYFVFSTSARFLNVPVAVVPGPSLVRGPQGPAYRIDVDPDPASAFDVVPRVDAMPDLPPGRRTAGSGRRASVGSQGATSCTSLPSGRTPPDPQNQECIGRAVASRPEGPYEPEDEPITCGLQGRHGALDPSVFVAPNGEAVLHVAFGGTSTPLWSIPLGPDGTPSGPPQPLLGFRQPWEYWFLENPSMFFDGEHFTLAYSAGDWRSPSYSTGLARCSTPTGPCRSDPAGPWLSSAGGVSGPGGLSFFTSVDGRLMAAHHGYAGGAVALFGGRHTFIRDVAVSAGSIELR